jgi:mono/diheme cytochrome c family protein
MRPTDGMLPAGLAVVVTLLVVGCGGGRGAGESTGSVGEAEASRARQLFEREGCVACHGEMTQGIENAGPALHALAPYWDVPRLMEYINDPTVFRAANPDFEQRRDVTYEVEMPAFDHLSAEQRKLLARWLLTR